MSKVLLFLKREFLEMLPPTIFFFMVFHLIAFLRALMTEQYGIQLFSSAVATIGALIVGKSILIADALPFSKFFWHKRPIYNVMWRTFLYATVVLLFQFLEELIPLVSKYGGFTTAGEHLMEAIRWPRFWATHILLVAFLVVYNIGTAVIRAIGRDKFVAIFLDPR